MRESASCAPLGTHLKVVPSRSDSLIALAISWTLNSEHDGGAVLVIMSYKLLQSVIVRSVSSCFVGTVMAGASFIKASSGFFHCAVGS